MTYDLKITPAQLDALAEWAITGLPYIADIELRADDRILVAAQGDDTAAWDTGGEPVVDPVLRDQTKVIGRDLRLRDA